MATAWVVSGYQDGHRPMPWRWRVWCEAGSVRSIVPPCVDNER
jgi:hypothetical protein